MLWNTDITYSNHVQLLTFYFMYRIMLNLLLMKNIFCSYNYIVNLTVNINRCRDLYITVGMFQPHNSIDRTFQNDHRIVWTLICIVFRVYVGVIYVNPIILNLWQYFFYENGIKCLSQNQTQDFKTTMKS